MTALTHGDPFDPSYGYDLDGLLAVEPPQPPGQFAIHNALPGDKRLFVLRAGHVDYPERQAEEARLLAELADFFAPLAA